LTLGCEPARGRIGPAEVKSAGPRLAEGEALSLNLSGKS
jgi:hypothetical protein